MAEETITLQGEKTDAPPKTAFEEQFMKALKTDLPNPDTETTLPKEEVKPITEVKKEVVVEEPKNKIPDELFKDGVIEAKLEEVVKSELDDIPAPKDEKAKGNFEALRTKAKEHEKRANDLQKQFEELKKTSNVEELNAKLAALEKQNSEYSDIVSKARVEMHPEFQEKYVKGRNKLMDQAKQIVSESGGEANDIETALNLQGKPRVDALREIATQLDSFQSGRLGRVVDALTELDGEASGKIKDSQKAWQEMQIGDKAKAEAKQREFSKAITESFQDASKSLSAELEVLQKIEGADWWNEQADKILKDAKHFYETNNDLKLSAKHAILAKAAPLYRDLYIEQRKETNKIKAERNAAKKELEGVYSRSPGLGGNKGEQGKQKPRDFIEHYTQVVAGDA